MVNDYIFTLDNMIPLANTFMLTPRIICRIAKTFPNNKVPGMDKITAIMVKRASYKIFV